MEPPCITIDDTQDIISPESVPGTLALPVTPRKDQRSHAEMIASAVQDRVEKNISVQKVAEKYNVAPRTIQTWVKKSGKIVPRKHAAKPPRTSRYMGVLKLVKCQACAVTDTVTKDKYN